MPERGPERIRVLVADDHRMVRAGLCLLLRLEPDIEIVGEASDGYEARALTADLKPDVLVADVRMPGPGGVELARQLKDELPAVRVIVLTMHEDSNLAREAQTAGAAGYVVKRAAESDLIAAIRSAARDAFYVDSALDSVVGAQRDGVAQPEARPGPAAGQTSAAEDRLLRLLAQGLSMSQAAQALNADSGALEAMRDAVMQRLGLHSRIDIMRYARDHGLLEDTGERGGVESDT
jgi:DNA-binding NarL/FixJ family response regulator